MIARGRDRAPTGEPRERERAPGPEREPEREPGPEPEPEREPRRNPRGAAPRDSRSLLSAATYAFASAGQRALMFLLLPLYTAVLSPAQYGRLSILLSMAGAVAILLAGGLDYSINRRFFQLQGDPTAQRRFVRSAWRALVVATSAITAVAVVLVLLLMPDGETLRKTDVVLMLVGTALFVSSTTVPMAVLRAQQRLRDYLVVSAVSAGVTTALTALLVVGLGLGVPGWLVAVIGANAATLLAAMFILPWGSVTRFDREGVRTAVVLGLPLVPHFLASWSLVLADRLVLTGLVTPSALGVYSLGANFALPVMILVGALTQGFIPTYAIAGVESATSARLRGTITLQATIVVLVGCVAALLGPPLAVMVSPAEYAGGARLIPWIALGYVFLGLYGIPMNAISMIAARTRFIWMFTMFAAVVNIGLIYLLVPSSGLIGAAIASAAGYFVLLALIAGYATQIRLRLSIDVVRLARVGALTVGAYAAALLTTPGTGVASIALRCVWLVGLFVAIGLATGIRLPAGRSGSYLTMLRSPSGP